MNCSHDLSREQALDSLVGNVQTRRLERSARDLVGLAVASWRHRVWCCRCCDVELRSFKISNRVWVLSQCTDQVSGDLALFLVAFEDWKVRLKVPRYVFLVRRSQCLNLSVLGHLLLFNVVFWHATYCLHRCTSCRTDASLHCCRGGQTLKKIFLPAIERLFSLTPSCWLAPREPPRIEGNSDIGSRTPQSSGQRHNCHSQLRLMM